MSTASAADLQHHEHVQDAAAWPDPDVVDGRDEDNGGDGDRGVATPGIAGAGGEPERHTPRRSSRRPPPRRPRSSAGGPTRTGTRPAGDRRRGGRRTVRPPAGTARPSSAYANAPTSATTPPATHAASTSAAAVEPLRDDRRVDEDARADDAPDDDHGRVERAERAGERLLHVAGKRPGLSSRCVAQHTLSFAPARCACESSLDSTLTPPTRPSPCSSSRPAGAALVSRSRCWPPRARYGRAFLRSVGRQQRGRSRCSRSASALSLRWRRGPGPTPARAAAAAPCRSPASTSSCVC